MKISKKEKIMLCILAIVLVGFVYYEFIYLNQTSRIADKTKIKNQLEEKYKNTIDTINSLDAKKSEIKILNVKVGDKSNSFYPTISQEHLILELDKLLKDSGLEGGFIFNKIEVAEVPKAEKTQENLKESSITKITEKYNNEVNNNIEKEDISSDESTKDVLNENESASNNENNSSEDEIKDKRDIEQIKFELNFSGSYISLNAFLNSIRNYERNIVVNSITISQKTIDSVSGTVNLEVYAIPKVNDDLDKYLNWTLNNTYGKVSPFSLDGSVGNVATDIAKPDSDFLISARSVTSVVPTVTIGKTNDNSKVSYIYSDNNEIEEVEIVITEKNDKYYYKYKTSNDKYPSNYNELGQEFIPSSDNINIKILSENRVTSDDKSGVKLNITNKTDKLVNVEIDSDDSQNPRVTINGDDKNISVTNK